MALFNQIEDCKGNPAELERLYRQSLEEGCESEFKDAVSQIHQNNPNDHFLLAWVYRLDDSFPSTVTRINHQQNKDYWWRAITISFVLSVLFVLIAQDKPPIPSPEVASSLFWIAWSPLTAIGILIYLSLYINEKRSGLLYFILVTANVIFVLYTAFLSWNRTDDVAIITALHLPVLVWITIGLALTFRYPNPTEQSYSFLMKSAETSLAGVIYFCSYMLFLGLTTGIFAVMEIEFDEYYFLKILAFGIGAIPLLALASVYDPNVAPAEQDWSSGFSKIMRIVTLLLLPLAILVLLIYDFFFIPVYFWRPFEEREVLFVYNATIMAVMALLTIVVSGSNHRSEKLDSLFRNWVYILGGLIAFLNLYALAAIVYRITEFGFTPNRYVVLGSNITTLIMLIWIGYQVWSKRTRALDTHISPCYCPSLVSCCCMGSLGNHRFTAHISICKVIGGALNRRLLFFDVCFG